MRRIDGWIVAPSAGTAAGQNTRRQIPELAADRYKVIARVGPGQGMVPVQPCGPRAGSNPCARLTLTRLTAAALVRMAVPTTPAGSL